jgi:Tol biopolymer transport system component
MTMKTHRFARLNALVSGLGIALILLLALSDPVASQSRRSRRGSSGREDPNLPSQRTPLPSSALNLRAIPHRIVFESLRETGGESNWEIVRVDADGSNMLNLTNTPDVDEHYPHASPDGSKILFVAIEGEGRRDRKRNVYYMNADGTGRTKVAENGYQPTWSGDGRSVAYLMGEYERYNSSMTSNEGLAIYDLAAKTTREHPEDGLRMLYNLNWSPDGNWFIATSRGGRRGNVLFEPADEGIRSLSISGCRPDISPDGKKIAWGRTDHELRTGTFNPSARRENVVDQKPVVVVGRREKVYHVDWSPDGRYLAFSYGPSRGGQGVGQRASGWNISILEIASGKWVQITTDGNHNKEPDWVAGR